MAKLLRFPELKSVKGIPYTRTHIDRLEKSGDFPVRVKLGKNTVGWIETEVDDYIDAKAAQRAA